METLNAVIENKVDYWDHIAHEWKRAQSDLLWREHSDAVNVALLSRWLSEKPVGRLLKTDLFDEAVSEGLVPFLRLRANTVVGMDVSLMALRMARSRLGSGPEVCADVRFLPFADESFDAVVSNSTLDHFRSLGEMAVSLRELHRVLRTGGQLLLTIDNLANPAIGLRNVLPFKVLHQLGLVPYYVGVTCGPRRLRRMLEESGLEILEMTAVLHCPRLFAVWLTRVLQSCATQSTQQWFVRWLMRCERLEGWPTRFLTGNFIAVRCVKRSEG
jgi:SAM-dependent methyltransferase